MAKQHEQKSYTVFEKARLIGARALQISMGAPFAVKLSEEDLKKLKYSPIEIAKMEYQQGVIPIDVRRHMPE
jgi:DNA-directed RNA polymerase subunit K